MEHILSRRTQRCFDILYPRDYEWDHETPVQHDRRRGLECARLGPPGAQNFDGLAAMSIAFAARVRAAAQQQILMGKDCDDLDCLFAAMIEAAVFRANKLFPLPKGFLIHDPAGYPIFAQLIVSTLIMLAPDRQMAIDALGRVIESLPKERPDPPEYPGDRSFKLERAHYKPPKERPKLDEAEVQRFIEGEALRARRIVDAWRAGVDLERLPA